MSHENGYKSVQKFADDIVKYKDKGFLPNKKRITSLMLKRAYFVINSRKFKHQQSGGELSGFTIQKQENNCLQQIDPKKRDYMTNDDGSYKLYSNVINSMGGNTSNDLSFINNKKDFERIADMLDQLFIKLHNIYKKNTSLKNMYHLNILYLIKCIIRYKPEFLILL